MNAFTIDVILSYVPVTNPSSPINNINIFFESLKGPRVLFPEQTTNSIIGGNKRAKAVLLTAPTNEINRLRFGMASARITVKKKKKIGFIN